MRNGVTLFHLSDRPLTSQEQAAALQNVAALHDAIAAKGDADMFPVLGTRA